MKKLLIVSDFFYPHWTGISKSMYNLIRAVNSDYQITVLTVRYDKTLKRSEKIFSSNIIREDFLFPISRSKYSLSVVLRFILMIREFDIVLINSPSSNLLPLALITKICKKKLLIFHQGDLILPDNIFNFLIERIFDLSCFIGFALSDKLSTYTDDYAKHSRVMRPYLKKFIPLLLPIILSDEKTIKYGKKFSKLIQMKRKGILLFGFAGRFVEEKGFDILFKAMPEVMKNNSKIHFVFAGETDIHYEHFFAKSEKLYKVVEKNVTRLGLLQEDELLSYLKLLDYIIVPSRSDCFNLIQAEAMLAGVPSIVSDIPGARYLVQTTGYGAIFTSNDVSDLIKKIINVIKQKQEIQQRYSKVLAILDNTKNVAKIKEFITS